MEGEYARKAGKYNRDAAYNEAEAMDIQAGQEIAVSSIRVAQMAKELKSLMSEQRAAAAAGGGSTDDPTVQAIMAEAETTSILDQMREMASGEERAQQIRHGADLKRREGDMALIRGKQKKRASILSAVGQVASSAGSWGMKYGWSGGTDSVAKNPPAVANF